MDNLEKTVSRSKALQEIKAAWTPLHKDLTDYILPRKNHIYDSESRGQRRTSKVYDSTAIYANRILAAGLLGRLSSPYQPWFRIGLDDPDLARHYTVRPWLEFVENVFYKGFRISNFYSEIHEAYLDMGCVGMPGFYMTRDPDTIFRFSARHISELCVAENRNHVIDTVYRTYPYTAKQAVNKWGAKAGEKILQLYNKKPDARVKILEAVEPRNDRDPRKLDRLNMPYKSLTIDLTHEHMIAASGYHEFPYAVPRWAKSSNEVYARSPGSDVLSEIITANNVRKTAMKAGQKGVDPPIFLPDEGFTGGTVNLTPGSVNFYRMGKGDIVIPPVSGNVPLATQQLEDSRAMIREGFYVNLFLALLEKTNITATQTLEIADEKMVLLGPTLTRLLTEGFDPIFHRGMGILVRDRRIPPPPPEHRGTGGEIEYFYTLAKAPVEKEHPGIAATNNFAAFLAEHNPSVMDNLNDDENLRRVAELNDMPTRGLRPPEQVKQMREARVQAEDEEVDKEDAASLAGVMQTLAKAGKEAAA